jgi:hypothetical protein
MMRRALVVIFCSVSVILCPVAVHAAFISNPLSATTFAPTDTILTDGTGDGASLTYTIKLVQRHSLILGLLSP